MNVESAAAFGFRGSAKEPQVCSSPALRGGMLVLQPLPCKNTLIALQIATIRLQIIGQTQHNQSLRRTKRVACQWNTRPVKCSRLNPCERSHKSLERRASCSPRPTLRGSQSLSVRMKISHARGYPSAKQDAPQPR